SRVSFTAMPTSPTDLAECCADESEDLRPDCEPRADHDHKPREENPEAGPAVPVVAAPEHMVEVSQRPGREDEHNVDHDEGHETDHHREVHGPGRLDGKGLRESLRLARPQRRHPEPRHRSEGGGDEDHREVGNDLEAVVIAPAVLGGPREARVLQGPGGPAWGETPRETPHPK